MNIRNGLIIFSILIIGVAILIFRLYRQKKQSLTERETLLKEIHHRVKNNLQIISSLLNIQAAHLKDDAAKDAVREGQNRVKSMALIHKNLYQHDDLSGIKVNAYFNDLIKAISSTYLSRNRNVEIKVEAQDVLLDIDTAVPVGLIVNELVSNAFKYAFPNNADGEILITFEEKDDRIHLTVSDNGIGIPDGLDLEKLNSLGLRIVKILTNQLEGECKINAKNGTEFQFTFKPLKIRKQEA